MTAPNEQELVAAEDALLDGYAHLAAGFAFVGAKEQADYWTMVGMFEAESILKKRAARRERNAA